MAPLNTQEPAEVPEPTPETTSSRQFRPSSAQLRNGNNSWTFFNEASRLIAEGHDYIAPLSHRHTIPAPLADLLSEPESIAVVATCLKQFPHISESDPSRCDYYASEAHARAGRVTTTTWGRYTKKLIPSMADHEVRSIADSITSDTGANGEFKIVRTMPEILDHLMRGPHSCMRYPADDFDCAPHHPYEVYDPALGWGMAVRVEDGDVISRAMVYEGATDECDDGKFFVRTFRKGSSDYSYSCEKLSAWLESQGYIRRSAWPEGTRLRRIDAEDSFVAPYIDGDLRQVEVLRDTLELRYGGDHCCDETNGFPDTYEGADMETCDSCGERFHEDDMTWTHDDRGVCPSCLRSDYTWAVTSLDWGVRHAYVSNDSVIYSEAEDEWFLDALKGDGLERCDYDDEWYLAKNGRWHDKADGTRVFVADMNYDDWREENPEPKEAPEEAEQA